MAVSYLSTPIQDTPYILPVDLNLLGRVNQYKQTMFYNNANALKQQMAQLKNTDILNPEQRDRLQQGYNQVVNRISEAGPIDFSDLSIVNSIEGLGSQIYDDQYIMNGIASTKQIRKMQSIREKIKTDPKLIKYQNAALEWYDNEYIKDYIGGGLDASYQGSSTPTLSLGNTSELIRNGLKNMPPDVEVTIGESGNPYWFNKRTGEQLSSERIHALMQANLTPELQKQIQIEGAFRMRDMTDAQIGQELALRRDKDLRDVDANIQRLKDLAATSINDDIRQSYEQQILENENHKSTISERYNSRLSNLPTNLLTREGRIAELGSLYTEDLFKNTAAAFSYNKIKNDLQYNQGLAFQQKMEWEKEKFNRMLQFKQQQAANKKGTNTSSLLGDPNAPISEVGTSQETEDQMRQRVITTDNIDQSINNAVQGRQDLLKSFYLNQLGPNAEKIDLEGISELNNLPGLQGEDLRTFVKNNKLNQYSIQYFNNMANAMDNAAKGDYSQLQSANFPVSEAVETLRGIATYDAELAMLGEMKSESQKFGLSAFLQNNKNLSDREKQLISGWISDGKYNDGFTLDASSPSYEGDRLVFDILNKAGLVKSRPIYQDPNASGIDKFLGRVEDIAGFAPRVSYIDLSGIKEQQDRYFKENNNSILIPSNVYFNFKNIEKTNSELLSYVSRGYFNEGDNETNIETNKNLSPENDKIEIISVTQMPFYNRQNNQYARINFNYQDANGETQSGYKYVDKNQIRSFGINPPSDIDERKNYLLHTKGQLPKVPLLVESWKDTNPVVQYQIIRTVPGQIQARITLDGQDIVLKKVPDPSTGTYVAPSTSWEIETFLNKFFLEKAGLMDRNTVTQELRKLSLN